jgi:hypothetical protein
MARCSHKRDRPDGLVRPRLSAVVGVLGLSFLLAGCGMGSGEEFSVRPRKHPSTANLVARAMLKDAKAGRFQAPPKGHRYTAPVECRVDVAHGFHGRPIYLCKISITKLGYGHLYEWGAWYRGSLHTHNTDPRLIRTITGPFDPPF